MLAEIFFCVFTVHPFMQIVTTATARHFIYAGKPDEANRLYEYFCKVCGEKISGKVEKGVFGADMKVSLLNDGPFTIILECRNGEIIP